MGKKKKFGVLVRTPRTRVEQPMATKLRREGPNVECIIDLADDFIGGFAPSKTDDQDVGEGVLVKRNGLWQPIVSPSPWVRRWGRIDVWVERFGRSVLWHAAPKQWAAEQPRECALIYNNLRCHDAEQRGRSAKRLRAFEEAIFFKSASLEKAEAQERVALLEEAKDEPHGGDKAKFARLMSHEHRGDVLRHHEPRIQKLAGRWFKPSRALEEKRFRSIGKLPAATAVGRTCPIPKAQLRAEAACLLADYRGEIMHCPPEIATAELIKRLNAKPVGRPREYHADRPATNAERSARRHARRRIVTQQPSSPRGVPRARRSRASFGRGQPAHRPRRGVPGHGQRPRE